MRSELFLLVAASGLAASGLAACGGGGGGRPAVPEPAPAEAEAASGANEETTAPSRNCQATKVAFNLAVGGTVTSSTPGENAASEAKMAFDDNTGTKWSETTTPTPWIVYELAGTRAQAVATYTLTSVLDRDTENDPKSWELQGSNDPGRAESVTWTTLDKQNDQSFPARQLTKSYKLTNGKPFHRYRLLVTANGGGPGLKLAELQLFGPGTPVFSVDDTVRGSANFQFRYSSGWEGHTTNDVDTLPLKYGLSSSWSNRRDEWVSFAFVGSQVILYGITHTQHGIIAVAIDGGPTTLVDLYGHLRPNTLVYTSPVMCPPGPHTLMIKITGDRNPESTNTFGSIDRVMVIP